MVWDKRFYRKLDELLDVIGGAADSQALLALMVDRLRSEFREELGIESGRVYRRDEDEYVCVHSSGGAGAALEGLRIPADYPLIETIKRRRLIAVDPDFPGYDSQLEDLLQVNRFAAFVLDGGLYLVALGLAEINDEDSLVFALGTVRHTLDLRLRQVAMEEEIDQVEAIQLSLLPKYPPRFNGFDIAARTHAAEEGEVGGDVHDFLRLDDKVLGLAVGDASGHGLAAALQARDVIVGLRMGVVREMKITAVMRRLNRVIHASNLSTRFVSLFYGELEPNGNLMYVNAGHCEPMLIDADGVERLDRGGIILGPTPDAEYERGFVRLMPGSQLLLFSDGLIERESGGEQFGEKRLLKVFRECYDLTSAETVEVIIERARAFGGSDLWQDDVTVVVVKPVN